MIKKVSWLGVVCLLGMFTYAAQAGVIVEGEGEGLDKVTTLEYQPERNRYILNGGPVLRCPVTPAEMLEIVKALRLDDRMGVAAKSGDEPIVYGGLTRDGEVARKLRAADDFLRAVVFADQSRLQDVSLPGGFMPQGAKQRERGSVVYYNFDGVKFRQAEGAYWPEGGKGELVLIPMAKQNNPDGSYQPDYDALEKGEIQKEDLANAEHIRAHKDEYLEIPALRAAVKISEAAAFVRHLRACGIDLSVLAQKLEQGGAFTLGGKMPVMAATSVTNEEVAELELQSQNLYSESIRSVLLQDNRFATENAVKMTRSSINDGTYVKFRKCYLENVRKVDLSHSPVDFQQAYAAHADAWEKALNWLATQRIADTPEAFDAFKNAHAPYRAELGATFRKCKEVAAAYLK